MKRMLLLGVPLLLSLILFGCGTDVDSEPDVEGYVLKVEEDRMLVAEDISAEAFDDIKDKSVSDFGGPDELELLYISYDDASEFEKGDHVGAWINDVVEDSYPRQTGADKISVKENGISSFEEEHEGIIANITTSDGRGDDDEGYRMLVISDMDVADISGKTADELTALAQENNGAVYYMNEDIFDDDKLDLNQGLKVKVYWGGDEGESNPPVRKAEKISVIPN